MREGKFASGGIFYIVSIFVALICVFVPLLLGIVFDSAVLSNEPDVNFRQVIPILSAFFIIAMHATGAHQVGRRRLFEVVYGVFVAVILVNIAMPSMLFFDISYRISFVALLLTTETQFMLLCIWAVAFHRLRFAVFPKLRAVIVSDNCENAEYCAKKVRTHSREFEVAEVTDERNLHKYFEKFPVIITYKLSAERLAELGAQCLAKGKQLCVIPDMWELGVNRSKGFQFGDLMALRFKSIYMTKGQNFVKRFYDIILSTMFLIITGLPILVFAGIIFLQDKHNPFYRQERLTRGERIYKIIKLRTMVWDAERDSGPVLASNEDSRITKFGAFLRRTRLDELPQFYNVLKGDMSIVGPRPERPFFTEEYSKTVPDFKLRLAVKAGITGMAHVYGRYDTPPDERIKLDIYYMLNYSPALDIKIIIETVRIMLSRSYSEGVKGKQGVKDK
jgi:exopolysaccharide biosynthesis polyprenyl glycosylphosphotransferase